MNVSDPCLSLEWVEFNDTVRNRMFDCLYLTNPYLAKYLNVIRASNNYLGLVCEYYSVNLSNYHCYPVSINLFNVCKQILLGLEYLNSKGIYHRQLSLQCVLIDNFNNVKLGRYALSLIEFDMHTFLDNILYLSPETVVYQPLNIGIDVSNDIWSLGIILLQLLDITYSELLSSLSKINLTHAANIAMTIIYHKLITISLTKGVSFSTIGLNIEAIKPYFCDFYTHLIPRLRNWYNESEISVIENLSILDELLKFITGYNIIQRYHKQLTCNDYPSHIKILCICYKCLIINTSYRPTASQLLEDFYTTLQSDNQYNATNSTFTDIFELFLHSNIAKYNTLVPSKYHCNSPYKIKCPEGLRLLRKLRSDNTITPIAGIYALTIRPSCGYSRRVAQLYNWLRMFRFDHVLTHYNEFRKISLAEARIDFPVSHRLIVYLIALDIINFDTSSNFTQSVNINQQLHQANYSINNQLSNSRVKIAINYLLNTNNEISYYPGLEDICCVITSITDNQQVINELFCAIVTKFVKPFYCSSFDAINQLIDKFDRFLRFFDPELYYHLVNLDFKCNSFLIEWLATLFSHILSLDKLLLCWDYIIVQGTKYQDYILYIALAMIYSCKSYIVSSSDTNQLMKSINIGMLFVHIPMVASMATRLASINNYFNAGMCKNITIINEFCNDHNSLKMFEKRPMELLSLNDICGIDLHKLYCIVVIGTDEFYEMFLSKYKYPLVQFQKIDV